MADTHLLHRTDILDGAEALMSRIRRLPSVQPYYRSERERASRDLFRLWRVATELGIGPEMRELAREQIESWVEWRRKAG